MKLGVEWPSGRVPNLVPEVCFIAEWFHHITPSGNSFSIWRILLFRSWCRKSFWGWSFNAFHEVGNELVWFLTVACIIAFNISTILYCFRNDNFLQVSLQDGWKVLFLFLCCLFPAWFWSRWWLIRCSYFNRNSFQIDWTVNWGMVGHVVRMMNDSGFQYALTKAIIPEKVIYCWNMGYFISFLKMSKINIELFPWLTIHKFNCIMKARYSYTCSILIV